MVSVRHIDQGWTVEPSAGPGTVQDGIARIPATVPGCVHTDLLAAGVIADPYHDGNEHEVSWIGRTDWTYRTTFDWAAGAGDRVELVCEGLDTVATLTLNDREIGRTRNMHRGYRLDVTDVLVEGPNQLEVRFACAYDYAVAEQSRLGDRPNAYADAPFNFVRKMASNFGWDWGPRLLTCGIWRPISLQNWRGARLDAVRPQVSVDGARGVVRIEVELDRTDGREVVVSATLGGAAAEVTTTADQAAVVLTVGDIERWHPRGRGPQTMYDLIVTLTSADGDVLDRWQRRIGFRSVALEGAEDEVGSSYRLLVNDEPVWIRGVNWITDDCFPSRITRERLAERLGQCVDANVNYVRVWGGGLYESDDFYDLCDELGLLVGQDFLFACAAYPEEEPLRSEVVAEAEENVTRLLPHPSLVTWTGNNENIWGHEDWGWIEALDGRTWGAGYYYDVLPRIVGRLDPGRPYWPGSPYSGRPELYPNDPARGTMHIWDVWNTIDYAHYRDYVPRMAAEFGYQGPPTYTTIRDAIHDEPLTARSPGMVNHQKAEDGDAKLQRGLAAHLPAPVDFDDWHFLTQLNQARAVRLAVEHFRSHQPVCMGSIVWQFNDCWPVTSWATVDGYGRRKPLWYALQSSFRDRLLTVQPRGDGLALIVVNDTAERWSETVTATRYRLDGEVVGRTELGCQVGARSVETFVLPRRVSTPDDATFELLRVEGDASNAEWFFAEDKDIRFPPAAWSAQVSGNRLTVTAETLLRDLTLFADRIDPDAWSDQAMVTLLPGESVTFTVQGVTSLDPQQAASAPALRAVNDAATSGVTTS